MKPSDFAMRPVEFCGLLWPRFHPYDRQRDVLLSVRDNDETLVVGANMTGKDAITAMCVLWFFLTRTPCRVMTTSVDGSQLSRVLWGEMLRFIQQAAYPLEVDKGGPLEVTHMLLKRPSDPLSYIVGRVAAQGEGMLGHHVADVGDGVPRTLGVADEASAVDDTTWDMMETWAKRRLAIGNAWSCNNFFLKGIKGGDIQ